MNTNCPEYPASNLDTSFIYNGTSGKKQNCSTGFLPGLDDFPSTFQYDKPAVLIFGKRFFAYLTPIILVIGLIGNSLSLAVFTSKNMRKLSASTYLAALSIADICTLLFYVFVEWLRRGLVFIHHEAKVKFLDSNGFCQMLLYLSYVSRIMSTWIIVVFTIERFMGVCFPLKAFKKKSVKIILGMLFLSCVLVIYKPVLSGEYTLRGRTACASNPKYSFESFVLDAIFAFSITLIPFIIITVLNALIMRALFLRNIRHSDLFAEETKIRLEFTLILLAISFFFVAFNLPYSAIWIRHFIASKLQHQSSIGYSAANIDYWNGTLLITRTIFFFNYCVNFFLYSITGAYFRKELATMLHIRRKSRRIYKSHIRCSQLGSITHTSNGLHVSCPTYVV